MTDKLKQVMDSVAGLKKSGKGVSVKKPVQEPRGPGRPVGSKTKPSKHPGGRPPVVDDSVVLKLEYAFALGCSDLEACFYADISKTALYNYQELHPEFTERKAALKKRPILLARKVIVDALIGDDVNSAHKVMDRHDGTKQVLVGDPDQPIQTVNRIELVPLIK